MQYLNTWWGNLPLPDEHIPRKRWNEYREAAIEAARNAWIEGSEYEPLTLAELDRGRS